MVAAMALTMDEMMVALMVEKKVENLVEMMAVKLEI